MLVLSHRFQGPPHHLRQALQGLHAADQCQGHSLFQEITSDTGRQRVAQIRSCPPLGTGCSSYGSFRDDSAAAQTARLPLCRPQELCLQLPNTPGAGCLPQPWGGWQRPSTFPARVPVANLLVYFVTSELGPAYACPQSLFTPSRDQKWLNSCHRRSELQHKIRVQSAWYFCPLGKGKLWGPGVGCRNW